MKLTKNFDSSEFACSHCGREGIKLSLVYELQRLRDEIDLPIHVNSGYRCSKHPAEAVKLKPGRHTEGIAADIKVPGMAIRFLYNAIERMGTFQGIGVDPEAGYVHVDLRPARARWAYQGGKTIAWNGKWETLPGAQKISNSIEKPKEKSMNNLKAGNPDYNVTLVQGRAFAEGLKKLGINVGKLLANESSEGTDVANFKDDAALVEAGVDENDPINLVLEVGSEKVNVGLNLRTLRNNDARHMVRSLLADTGNAAAGNDITKEKADEAFAGLA